MMVSEFCTVTITWSCLPFKNFRNVSLSTLRRIFVLSLTSVGIFVPTNSVLSAAIPGLELGITCWTDILTQNRDTEFAILLQLINYELTFDPKAPRLYFLFFWEMSYKWRTNASWITNTWFYIHQQWIIWWNNTWNIVISWKNRDDFAPTAGGAVQGKQRHENGRHGRVGCFRRVCFYWFYLFSENILLF